MPRRDKFTRMFTPLSASNRATLLLIVSACCFGSVTTLTVLTNRTGLPFITAMSWRYVLGGFILFLLMKSTSSIDVTWQKKATGSDRSDCTGAHYIPLALRSELHPGRSTCLSLLYVSCMGSSSIRAERKRAGHICKNDCTYPRDVGYLRHDWGTVCRLPEFSRSNARTRYSPALCALSARDGNRSARPTPSVSTFYLILGAGATFLIASVITGQMQLPPSLEAWSYVGLLSVVCTVLAFTALIAGLRELGPVRTAIISTVEPFFTSIFGVLFLRENLTVTTFAGGALIAIGVVLLHWQGRKVSDRAERFTV